jgi:hypothetical protein
MQWIITGLMVNEFRSGRYDQICRDLPQATLAVVRRPWDTVPFPSEIPNRFLFWMQNFIVSAPYPILFCSSRNTGGFLGG